MTLSPTEAQPPELRRSGKLTRALRNGVIFTAALIGSAQLIGHLLPFPPVPSVATKYRYLAENRQRFDTLFIGSSRVFHQIDPKQFDAEVAALGGHTQSVNLAYDRIWPPETFYFLRRLLALRPPKLRYVFIELMPMDVNLDSRNDQTLRTAYWHDFPHTLLAWREILTAPRRPQWKWQTASQHAAIFLRWNMCLGRGAELLGARLSPKRSGRSPHWLKRTGFLPLNDKQIPAAELPGYLARVANLRRELPSNPVSPHFYEALNSVAAEVRGAGAEPIFLMTPSLGGENFTGLPAGVPVLAYNDPAKHPSLYEPDRRYDTWHLNEKGAAELTSLLARDFAAQQKWEH